MLATADTMPYGVVGYRLHTSYFAVMFPLLTIMQKIESVYASIPCTSLQYFPIDTIHKLAQFSLFGVIVNAKVIN